MFDAALTTLATDILAQLRTQNARLACAESCTGGLVSALLTAIPGSSDVFERGFVTYTNQAKHEMLGVPETLMHAHGEVSAEVAQAMAEGALSHSTADIALSITGIAGPGGGSADKPVGLVWMAIACKHAGCDVFHEIFEGDRDTVRAHTVERVLRQLITP